MAKYFINRSMLTRNGACSMSRTEFGRVFGKSAEITPENVRKARATVWLDNWRWPACRLQDKLLGANPSTNSPLYRDVRTAEDYSTFGKSDEELATYLNGVGDLWARYKAGER